MTGSNEKTVLMIDDDVKLCRLVANYLAPFGFAVQAAHNGPDGVDRTRTGKFDLIILDVMLPGLDGFAVLREIRAFSQVPVLMLTALGDESDRIVGLEIGADDYLPKTFSTRELLARIRAVTRRAEISSNLSRTSPDDEIEVGGLKVNPATREALLDGRRISLTALEFDLAFCLIRSAGRVLDRDRLLDDIAGRAYDVFDRSIDVHISSLRRKLGDDPKSPRFIKTIRSVGYMFVAEESGSGGTE